MFGFFRSIRNALGFFLLVMLFLFTGLLVIPGKMQTYTDILDTVLLRWLGETGLGVSWWVLGVIIALLLTGASTLVCLWDSLAEKQKRNGITLKTLSPQLIHLGVLMMLLGHLMGALSGVRAEGDLKEGEVFRITRDLGFRVEKIKVEESAGEPETWEVRGEWLDKNEPVGQDGLRPARPAYYKGLWLFLKSAEARPLHAGLMGRSDGGVVFLFMGSAVLLIGCAMNMYTKTKLPRTREGYLKNV